MKWILQLGISDDLSARERQRRVVANTTLLANGVTAAVTALLALQIGSREVAAGLGLISFASLVGLLLAGLGWARVSHLWLALGITGLYLLLGKLSESRPIRSSCTS